MTAHVIGFDLSLRAPAAVALPLDWRPGDWRRVRTWTTSTPDPASLDDHRGQLVRYRFIANWALDLVRDVGPKQIASAWVENYGFSKNNRQASRGMGSGEIVKLELFERLSIIVTPLTASTCRKFMCGTIPRAAEPKLIVQATLWGAGAPLARKLVEKHARWRDRGGAWTEDECDAFVICNTGLAESGGTALSLAAPERPRKRTR